MSEMQTGGGASSADYDSVAAEIAAAPDEPADALEDPLLDGDPGDEQDDGLDDWDANQSFLSELREAAGQMEREQAEQQLAEAIQAELADPYSPHFGGTALEVLAALAEVAAGERAAEVDPFKFDTLLTEEETAWRAEQRDAASERSVVTAETALDGMIAEAAPGLDPAAVRDRAERIREHVAAETGLTGRDLVARAIKEAVDDLGAVAGTDYDEVQKRMRRWENSGRPAPVPLLANVPADATYDDIQRLMQQAP